jgi:TRAP-type C4-dicarboxylate transport system permease small subunit
MIGDIRMLRKIERHFEEILAGTCVLIMAFMVFFQVVMRYVFSLPTSWSDEIAIYAMLWSVYISVAWAVRERSHIRVMNFINLFPTKVGLAITIFSDFIWLCFGFLMTYQSILLNTTFWQDRYQSPALGIEQKWPYMCLILGFGLMTARIIQVYYLWLKHDVPIIPAQNEADNHHA